MTLLPFLSSDVVAWRGELAVVREVRGDRVVVETEDGIIRITTQVALREMQVARRGAVA